LLGSIKKSAYVIDMKIRKIGVTAANWSFNIQVIT